MKGFTPERLGEVLLAAGANFPCDRIYAVERGPSGFDPAAPQHLSKWRFTVLANHPRLARAVTTYDAASGLLRVTLGGDCALEANLSRDEGRNAFAAWLSGFLGEDEDEALRVIASGANHRFTDDSVGAVSVINLASVRDLETKIGRPIDPLRMRANIYVEGWPSWAERGMQPGAGLRLGEVMMEVIKPIPRCVAIHVDPRTGARDLDLVAALRTHYGHVDCGLYLRVSAGGRLVEGDLAHPS